MQTRHVLIAALALSAVHLEAPALADTITWTGNGDGTNWSDGDNWNILSEPDLVDDVVIGGFTVAVDTNVAVNSINCDGGLTISSTELSVFNASSIHSVTMSGGKLRGFGKITITGQLFWLGGDLAVCGGLDFDDGAELQINYNGGAPLNIGGPINALGGSTIEWINGSVTFTNLVGNCTQDPIKFDMQSDSTMNITGPANLSVAGSSTAGGQLACVGTINQLSNTTTTISHPVQFEDGNWNIMNGQFIIATGMGWTQFPVEVTAPGELIYSGNGFEFPAADISGTGTFTVTGTIVECGHSSFDIDTVFEGGTMTGDAPATFQKNLFWRCGTMTGAGHIEIFNTGTLQISNECGLGFVVLARELQNNGTINWIGGDIFFGDSPGSTGSIVNNGTFNINTDGALTPSTLASGAITNNSEMIVDLTGVRGTASAFIANGMTLDNPGTLRVDHGTLEIATDDGSSTGSIQIGPKDAAARLLVSSPTDVNGYRIDGFTSPVQVTGTGTFEVTGEAELKGDVNIQCKTVLRNGTINLELASAAFDDFTWEDSGSAPSVIAGDEIGASSASVNGNFQLRGGQLQIEDVPSFVNSSDSPTTFETGQLTLANSHFTNVGELTVTGGQDILSTGNSELKNFGTGKLIVNAPAEVGLSGSMQFVNEGGIEVQAGRLDIAVNSTFDGSGASASAIDVAAGTELWFVGNFEQVVNISGPFTASGDGLVVHRMQIGGTINVNAPAVFQCNFEQRSHIRGSSNIEFHRMWDWLEGDMGDDSGGTTTIKGTGLGRVYSNATKTLRRSLSNFGTLDFLQGVILINTNTTLTNEEPAVLKFNGGQTIIGNGTLLNRGIIEKTDARSITGIGGTVTFTMALLGQLKVNSGTFHITSPNFTNFTPNTLTGGTYDLRGVFMFPDACLEHVNANLQLNAGSGAVRDQSGTDAMFCLQQIDPQGTLGADNHSRGLFGSLNNLGKLKLGKLGQVAVPDTYTPDMQSAVQVAVGDDTPPRGPTSVAGQLTTTDPLAVDGGLVVTVDGVPPSVGESFQIMTAPSVSGEFNCTDLAPLPDGRFAVAVNAADVTLSVVAGNSCAQDVTQDGTVDLFDLLDLIDAWGTCSSSCCPADVDGDATVNLFDLLDLIDAWGNCE